MTTGAAQNTGVIFLISATAASNLSWALKPSFGVTSKQLVGRFVLLAAPSSACKTRKRRG